MLFPDPIQYRKIDRYTVEFTMPLVLATAMDALTFPIVPKHILETPWKEGRFNETWGVDTPPWEIIGTGPFQMIEYRPSERIVMTRNPNYWRVDADGNSLPYITRFVMNIAGNQDAMRLMFDNRETNIYGVRPAELDNMMDNAARGGYTVYDGGPTFSTLFVVFNQNELFVPSPKVEWFQNLQFRQAVAHACWTSSRSSTSSSADAPCRSGARSALRTVSSSRKTSGRIRTTWRSLAGCWPRAASRGAATASCTTGTATTSSSTSRPTRATWSADVHDAPG